MTTMIPTPEELAVKDEPDRGKPYGIYFNIACENGRKLNRLELIPEDKTAQQVVDDIVVRCNKFMKDNQLLTWVEGRRVFYKKDEDNVHYGLS